MKLLNTVAAVTVLSFGLQYGAAAEDSLNQGSGYSGMEEVLVIAKRPAPMEEVLVLAKRPAAQEMEEIVVVAKRTQPSLKDFHFEATAANTLASACPCLADLGQMASRTPSL